MNPEGEATKYFSYPKEIKRLRGQITLDTRANGPAISAYLFAQGTRPRRTGSSNSWAIHHLYSGKFPYVDREQTLHAVKHPLHFTQSAGLVAAHPIADALFDEFPIFSWILRAQAFIRFGYDPDRVFCNENDELGFVSGKACEIVYNGETTAAL